MSVGLHTRMGGPCQVLSVPCFFTGFMVEPTARIVAVRVEEKEGKWKEDGHSVSVHVRPGILDMARVHDKENKELVLEAQDGHDYRLIV